MTRAALIVIATALATGCASRPDAIAPSYVSTVPYESWNCQQLVDETVRLQQAYAVAAGQQDQAANNDVMGVLLLGIPVSSLGGQNIAPQVANLKGQQQAVAQVMSRKNCGRRTG